ncbi:MAG TPA: flagellin [Dissulfurispiraceae bacterium]|nr:flagellin [Dissulfurispiraceae bacterium]
MALTINTNLFSLNAQRNLNNAQSPLATAMQRLSSGLRINSAKDDAAGLAIASRFTTQIHGLNQAVRNANDGISLSQTAEGALDEVTNNLQRIRELAVQSANATNSASDRAALQAEVTQRIQEIDRVATQTQFNGTTLLDGSFSSQVFQVGANANQTISVSNIGSARTSALGQGYGSSIAGTTLIDSTGITAAGLFTIQVGSSPAIDVFSASGGAAVAGNAKALATAINASGISGLQATAASTVSAAGTYAATGVAGTTASSITLNNINISVGILTGVSATDINTTLQAITANSAATGVTAVANGGGGLTLTAADGRNIAISFTGGTGTTAGLADLGLSDVAAITYGSYSVTYTGTSSITVGGTAAADVKGLADGTTNATATGTAVSAIDISTVSGANAAILSMDNALTSINSSRAFLGSIQNRFESTIANLSSTVENLTASRSRIQDADYAAETANLTKALIVQQAGISILSQANTVPQSVLALLGK